MLLLRIELVTELRVEAVAALELLLEAIARCRLKVPRPPLLTQWRLPKKVALQGPVLVVRLQSLRQGRWLVDEAQSMASEDARRLAVVRLRLLALLEAMHRAVGGGLQHSRENLFHRRQW